jgi:imidazolonepropionase-like amidohydrolase
MIRSTLHRATLALLLAAAPTLAAQDLAVRAGRLHTMAGPTLEDAVVIVRAGKIERIGPAASTPVPAGLRTLEAAVVTPGLIDGRTVVGLAGYLNQPHDQDQLEGSAPIQPQLRAIDAYNARETLVGWLREHGVTTIHTGHGPGALVSGQTMIVKTVGDSVEAGLVRPAAMVAAHLGTGALGAEGKTPGTRSKQVALLRAQLIKAGEYRDKRAAAKADAAPARELDLEALVAVLEREQPLLVTAHRAQDIASALRLAEEFGIDVVIDGGAEAYLMLDRIRAAGVPVLLHATMARQLGDLENASFGTAAALRAAGIPFALQSGYEAYVPKTRVVLFEAAIAAANGLDRDHALASITIDAARILKIDQRVGSLQSGKDADLVLFDGDPFEYTSRVQAVVIDGAVVSEQAR